MKRKIALTLYFSLVVLSAGVASGALAVPVWPSVPMPDPTPAFSPPLVTCADLDAAWARVDWPTALLVLTQLEAAGLTCENPLSVKRYAAHINYGVTLEQVGEVEAAVEQYQAALAVNGRGREALSALIRLDALPAPTSSSCHPARLAPYVPSPTPPGAFVSIEGAQLVVNGQPFFIRGVNYYPRHAPWERFLTEGDLNEMAEELDLISSAGFNTLRIFLWHDPLFVCAPEDAIPNPETFARLDAFIALARERGLRLVITLNDLPDLFFRSLYTDWARYDAQTVFIVSRYRDEPAVLAWDLRNEGDLDYGAQAGGRGRFRQEAVLAWLAHVAELVRANDSCHLLTAGWWGDAADTAHIVGVLSFHHWATGPELVGRVKALRAKSTQPILVEEIGYPGWGEVGEATQAQVLGERIKAAERSGAAGWLIWTAFDFVPADDQPANQEHHFGLWRADLTPKPALKALPLALPSQP